MALLAQRLRDVPPLLGGELLPAGVVDVEDGLRALVRVVRERDRDLRAGPTKLVGEQPAVMAVDDLACWSKTIGTSTPKRSATLARSALRTAASVGSWWCSPRSM